MMDRLGRALWAVGTPLRLGLVGLIRLYRVGLGQVTGGRCRFYPSCSAYAEEAIAGSGVVRGVLLSVWRVLRCSPLSKGGVDHPPLGRGWVRVEPGETAGVYDDNIQADRTSAVPGGTR